MRVLVCHPGTQHAGKLAALLRHAGMLSEFVTGFRLRQGSRLARALKLSGQRALDPVLDECTRQIRLPELLAKAAQCVGWGGERLMRLRNAWFQRLIPERALAAADVIVGFDTSSWILARRARRLGRRFILERTAVCRGVRVAIDAKFGIGTTAVAGTRRDVQGEIEDEEIEQIGRAHV